MCVCVCWEGLCSIKMNLHLIKCYYADLKEAREHTKRITEYHIGTSPRAGVSLTIQDSKEARGAGTQCRLGRVQGD